VSSCMLHELLSCVDTGEVRTETATALHAVYSENVATDDYYSIVIASILSNTSCRSRAQID